MLHQEIVDNDVRITASSRAFGHRYALECYACIANCRRLRRNPGAFLRVPLTGKKLDAIFADLTAGTPLRKSLAANDVHPTEFYRNINADASVCERYARAKQDGLDAVADEAMDIADADDRSPGGVNRDRLRVDTRKWLLAKLAPKKYGERTVIAGDPDAPIELNHAARLVESKLLSDAPAGDSAPKLVNLKRTREG